MRSFRPEVSPGVPGLVLVAIGTERGMESQYKVVMETPSGKDRWGKFFGDGRDGDLKESGKGTV